MIPGAVLFARYAYPPNALGYCGPSDSLSLAGALRERDVADLSLLAREFDGAWPYLKLIAGCNGIADPLDLRVVEAYWVGNDLLHRVPKQAMLSSLDERFARRAGPTFPNVANAVPLGGVPHHSFHVFAVYPWLGLLRAGRQGPALDVLDQCRVRWGRVVSVDSDTAVVSTSTLAFSDSRLVLAEEHEVRARRLARQEGNDPDLRAGDLVSLHWDWICQTLSPARARRLQGYTRENL
ncbi:MAG: DUF6390 family protein, partial [Acidimicrobiales bacterium]